ncbi:MAG: type IV secretory system conjugative DNA transfer family protein [Pseudomonadota bacterium]
MSIDHFPRGLPQDASKQHYPHARWWDPDKLTGFEKWQYRPGSVFLGAHNGVAIGVEDDRHMMTVAGSRAGKGRSCLTPNLCLYDGSILVIDPKGDLATITAARRGDGSAHCEGLGQKVFVLDPFEAAQGNANSYRAAFNPLDIVQPEGENGRDDAALLADALIFPSKGDSHWTDAARLLLTGLILHVCESAEPERRNLITVRELITNDDEGWRNTLAAMMCSDGSSGVIARTANSIAAMGDKERSGVISTATVQTDFLDSPAMRRVLSRSDFALADLKRERCTVYLSLPAGRMGTHARWLRLMIALTLEAMEREKTKPAHSVLVIMDEFHVLGPMKIIERAAGLIAGFGVRLWPVLQDLTQLKRDYPDSWETFLGNAGLTQWFGVNDGTTLDYLSKNLGKTTLETFSQSEISKERAAAGYTGRSKSHQMVELMTAEEIGRYFSRQSGMQLIRWAGTDPIAIERVMYDQSPLFEGKFDPDPNYALV